MGKRLLGIDYGSKRVGIAVSDPLNIIARGVTVIPNSEKLIGEIKRIAGEFDIEKIVVGIPLNLKGQKGSKAEEVEEFIRALEAELGIEIVRQDERFTTMEAHRTLRDMNVGKSKRRSRGTIDEMASALILQGYLDRQGG
ncbi:MAG: Holliday junction resolvase RuvX [Ignavibacteria bacterium]|nr:MAG: Holliday junction resolvase RuvX [Ignavibacteria bacterium]